MALIGNTVTFTGKFYLDGELVDPEENSVYFTTYQVSAKQKVIDQIQLNETHKVSTGVYKIDYIIPAPQNIDMIVEFKGTIDGKPSIGRETIKRSYAKN